MGKSACRALDLPDNILQVDSISGRLRAINPFAPIIR